MSRKVRERVGRKVRERVSRDVRENIVTVGLSGLQPREHAMFAEYQTEIAKLPTVRLCRISSNPTTYSANTLVVFLSGSQ